SDARLPMEAVRLVVLAGKPEDTAGWIDRHDRIVAPARAADLRSTCHAGEQAGLSLRQRAERVASQPAGVADVWGDAGVCGGVAQRHVAAVVDRQAAHPAVHAVVV